METCSLHLCPFTFQNEENPPQNGRSHFRVPYPRCPPPGCRQKISASSRLLSNFPNAQSFYWTLCKATQTQNLPILWAASPLSQRLVKPHLPTYSQPLNIRFITQRVARTGPRPFPLTITNSPSNHPIQLVSINKKTNRDSGILLKDQHQNQKDTVKINNLTLNFCKRLHKLLTGLQKSGKFLQTLAQVLGRKKMAHRKILYELPPNHITTKTFFACIAVLSLPLIIFRTCINPIKNKIAKLNTSYFNHLSRQKWTFSGGDSRLVHLNSGDFTTNINTISYTNWHFKIPVTTESA